MQPQELADLLDVTTNTVRRWCREYYRFLGPNAHPPKGKPRVFSDHDLRILHYVAAARSTGQPLETITAHLEAMQSDGWKNLPPVPAEWEGGDQSVPVAVAASKAYDVAQIAVLQRDLEYTRQALQVAQQRAEQLDQELTALRADKATGDDRIHALELELSQMRGEVATLQARLGTYTLGQGDRPLPVFVIIVAALLAGAILVALAVVIGAIVG